MDQRNASAPPRPGQEPIARLIREFPRKLWSAVLNGLAVGCYVLGGAFAAATIIGILGNPIWRWGCWLWNLWT